MEDFEEIVTSKDKLLKFFSFNQNIFYLIRLILVR